MKIKKGILCLGLYLISGAALAVNGVYWPQEKAAIPPLLKAGYHDIQILYIQPIRCEDNVYDINSVGFRAISKKDHVVTGVLCNGQVRETLTTVTEEK